MTTRSEKTRISVEQYLEEVARFCDDQYGNQIRDRFQDTRGTSELAMLAAPTCDELVELRRAVAIMTPAANFAIFMNGYALVCKRVS
jgi:hypothetical protein